MKELTLEETNFFDTEECFPDEEAIIEGQKEVDEYLNAIIYSTNARTSY